MLRIISAALVGFLVATTAHAELEWTMNYEDALATATEEEKLVFLEFLGSDWCSPCIALGKEVLTQEPFAEIVEGKLVLVKLDFPRDESVLPEEVVQQNYDLQQKFGIRGYPTAIVLNAEGEELSRLVGYNSGAQERWLDWLRGALEQPEPATATES